MIRHKRHVALAIVATAGLLLAPHGGGPSAAIEDKALQTEVKSAIDRGLRWLRWQQKENGSWENHPGISALALTAMARSPRAYDESDGPFMRNGVKYLRDMGKPDGGIYDRDLGVYSTAVSIMALCAVGNPDAAPVIEGARKFLVGQQTNEALGYEPDDKFYGGIGYGNDLRPDLSNLHFALEGLRASGLPESDETWGRAIAFLERCQNRSESNDQKWAANDGGFVYYPGFSVAGETKSYGSMTYAGIKSFIYAHLGADDPRVESAVGWIRENYELGEHPGLGADGLYYYYHTFAKALRVYGKTIIVDAQGQRHRWADELARTLLSRQQEDGYWVNSESGRWWEGNKALVTAEAILALEEALSEPGIEADVCPALTRRAAKKTR